MAVAPPKRSPCPCHDFDRGSNALRRTSEMRPEFGSELLTNVITAVILIGLLVSAAFWVSQ